MENLDKLPLPLLIAFGLGLAVIFGVRHLGLLSGERSTPAGNASTAQVAAVIVDPSALNRATAALEAQTLESVNAGSRSSAALRPFADRWSACARKWTISRKSLLGGAGRRFSRRHHPLSRLPVFLDLLHRKPSRGLIASVRQGRRALMGFRIPSGPVPKPLRLAVQLFLIRPIINSPSVPIQSVSLGGSFSSSWVRCHLYLGW